MEANDKISSEKEAGPTQKEEIGGDEGDGGWSGGGWGFSPFSYLSDLQKAAAVAAEEISRNAASVAQTAAKSIAEMQNDDAEGAGGGSDTDREDRNEKENLRRSALDKLENVGEDTYLSQGLKMVDTSVESFASGAWKALGSAWKGGSAFIQKIEHSAVDMADSIQQGDTTDSGGPSLFETGKALTFKGLQVLENVGKETMDLLISETGIEVDNRSVGTDHQDNEDQMYEEVSFDRCFYIYGGPEQLEELEALSSHYTLLFNRRKTKLSSDQKSFYEGKVKQVQQILDLNMETDAVVESDKGKKVETGADGSDSELKSLCDSSVSKAADMAAGFTSSLSGLAANDITQRTAGRLESIHSEGVHRLSEVCCFAVSQLMMLAKSVISSANKNESEKADDDNVKIEWPEDSVQKANIIRSKVQSMTDGLEAVSNSFITGISDVAEAYIAAIKTTEATDSHKTPPEKSIQDKANVFKEHLHADQTNAIGKIQDGLQYLCFVVVSTSISSA